jgi:hypothetical protein
VHRVLVAADQSRQRIDLLIGVPDLDVVREEPGLDDFATESAVH